jgi:uncharacterized protein (DUF1778 family)
MTERGSGTPIREALGDPRAFELEPSDWAAFVAAMNAPPPPTAAVRRAIEASRRAAPVRRRS